MSLSNDEIQHIAALAQLEIKPADIAELTAKMSRIVEFVDQLSQVDLKDVQPMAHPLDMNSRLRADEVTEQIDRDRYQQNSGKTGDGLYRVPRVIE